MVVPYNNLLHAGTREASGLRLADSVVIVDEAHNLLETIGSIHTCQLSYRQVSSCQLSYRQIVSDSSPTDR